MSLSPSDAQSALKDIEKTENRAAASQHGRHAAPHLVMWGIVWMIGYAVSAARPDMSWLWAPLTIGGVIGSVILGYLANRGERNDFGRRYGLSFIGIFMFVAGVLFLMQPATSAGLGAFIPLVVGHYYFLVGVWTRGWRMLPLGVAITVLTLVGHFILPEYFGYWMAAVGGGGLILGGLWMRSV